MKNVFVVLLVVALMSVAVGAMAAGTAKPKVYVISGVVKSVSGSPMTSFVVYRGSLHLPKNRNVTVSVTTDTNYFIGKSPATIGDIKVGAKVLVELTAAVKNGQATATKVFVKPAKTKGTK